VKISFHILLGNTVCWTLGRFIYTQYWEIRYVEHCGKISTVFNIKYSSVFCVNKSPVFNIEYSSVFCVNKSSHSVQHKVIPNTEESFMLNTVGRFIYTKYWGMLYVEHWGDLFTQNAEE
jgi:hypothetical protein